MLQPTKTLTTSHFSIPINLESTYSFDRISVPDNSLPIIDIHGKSQKIIILNGKKIDTLKKLYDLLNHALNFPDYFGRNLDALYDCLTELSFAPEYQSIHIVVLYENDFLSHENEQKKINVKKVFLDAENYCCQEGKKRLFFHFD